MELQATSRNIDFKDVISFDLASLQMHSLTTQLSEKMFVKFRTGKQHKIEPKQRRITAFFNSQHQVIQTDRYH